MGKNNLPFRIIAPGLMGKQYSREYEKWYMGSFDASGPDPARMYVTRVIQNTLPLRIEVPDAWHPGLCAACIRQDDMIDVGGGTYHVTFVDFEKGWFSIEPIDQASYGYTIVAGAPVFRRGSVHHEAQVLASSWIAMDEEEQFWQTIKNRIEIETRKIKKGVEELINE